MSLALVPPQTSSHFSNFRFNHFGEYTYADATADALERTLSLGDDAVEVSGIGSGSDLGAIEMLLIVLRNSPSPINWASAGLSLRKAGLEKAWPSLELGVEKLE